MLHHRIPGTRHGTIRVNNSFSSASSPFHDCSASIRSTASRMTEALPYTLRPIKPFLKGVGCTLSSKRLFPATWMPTARPHRAHRLPAVGHRRELMEYPQKCCQMLSGSGGNLRGRTAYSEADKKRSALMYSPDPLTDTLDRALQAHGFARPVVTRDSLYD